MSCPRGSLLALGYRMNKAFRATLSAYLILVGLVGVPVFIGLFGLLREVTFDVEFAIAVLTLPLALSAWLQLSGWRSRKKR